MNLKETFNKELLPQLQEKLGIDNIMAVPKVTKVVINMGVGEALTDKKHLESAVNDLESIAGQKVVVTKAKKSVASFKLREGWPVGCKVTLRGDRMYDFIERLVNVAIPRERDFRGLEIKSFDGRGNYTMGLKEQLIKNKEDNEEVKFYISEYQSSLSYRLGENDAPSQDVDWSSFFDPYIKLYSDLKLKLDNGSSESPIRDRKMTDDILQSVSTIQQSMENIASNTEVWNNMVQISGIMGGLDMMGTPVSRFIALSILNDDLKEWFELDCNSPYMLLVANIKKDKIIKGGNSKPYQSAFWMCIQNQMSKSIT